MATRPLEVTVVHAILLVREMSVSLVRKRAHLTALLHEIKLETLRTASLTIATRCTHVFYTSVKYLTCIQTPIYFLYAFCLSLGSV